MRREVPCGRDGEQALRYPINASRLHVTHTVPFRTTERAVATMAKSAAPTTVARTTTTAATMTTETTAPAATSQQAAGAGAPAEAPSSAGLGAPARIHSRLAVRLVVVLAGRVDRARD